MSSIRQETFTLSADTVRSLIETYLRSNTINLIKDNEDVLDMTYVPEALNNKTVIPIVFKIKKEMEGKTIHRNVT